MGFNQTKYIRDYKKEHYDEIKVSMPKGKKDDIKLSAKLMGMSMNEFLNRAIENAIEEAKGAD